MHIALFIKLIDWNQILLQKKIIFTAFLIKLLFRWAKYIFDFSVLLKQKV